MTTGSHGAPEPKGRIRFFQAASAPDQSTTGMRGELHMSDETAVAMREIFLPSVEAGLTSKLLAHVPGGISVLLLWAKPGFMLPRHSHDSDCFYYVQSGSILMGRREMRTGDSFFVPARTVYTYSAGDEGAEVLEIRHGVDAYDTTMSEQTPAQWARHEEVLRTHAAQWAGMQVSPTLAQHRAEDADVQR